ncbi:MAG: hydroxymethylbilane synthase [Candidatus Eremiobacterota bacterium]
MLRLGTRGSALALAQSGWVARRLRELHAGLEVELVVIKTTGDRKLDVPLSGLGGKGAFTREIEVALLAGQVDFAVHSLKDLPTRMPEGLILAAVPQREDPRDCVIAHVALESLPSGARLGTGSARRIAQLHAARPDLEFAEARGNLPTRVEKWRRGDFAGVVLAQAGLNRLGLDPCGLEPGHVHPLPWSVCLPAPGQGVLALEARADDRPTRGLLQALNHEETATVTRAERAFLQELEGNCSLPAGCRAWLEGDLLRMQAVLGREDGSGLLRESTEGPATDAGSLGAALAARLRVRVG